MLRRRQLCVAVTFTIFAKKKEEIESEGKNAAMRYICIYIILSKNEEIDFLSCISDWNPTEHWLEMTMATIRSS